MTQFFTPTPDDKTVIQVPFIEEARASFAPHYSAKKTLAQAEREVIAELAKLDAGSIRFIEGSFSFDKPRYGYRITFFYGGAQGRIEVAGLPIKGTVTKAKKKQVLVQALLNVRDWCKAAVTAKVFAPGINPLIPYLIIDGERTVAEVITSTGNLPVLAAGINSGFVEGDWSES